METINIEKAVSFLAGRCDHARSQDGVGFNGLDAGFGHSCADFLERTGFLTEKQRGWLAKILKKYTAQLAREGFTLDATLPGSVRPVAPAPRLRTIDLDLPGANFVISFPYDADLIAVVKQLPRRRFDKASESWLVPFEIVSARLVQALSGFTLTARAVDEIAALEKAQQNSKAEARATTADLDVPTKLPLRPYQLAGVQFALNHGNKVLIADEPGVGKTAQAIGFLAMKTGRPAVIFCPASVKLQWAREIDRFLDGEKVVVLNGQKEAKLPDATVYILNYDIAAPRTRKNQKHVSVDWLALLREKNVQTVILDESHKIKNPKSKRTRVVTDFAETCNNVLALTGTPILNRPVELWTTLNLLRPNTYNNFYSYATRFCGAYRTQYGLITSGASNVGELSELLADVMIRRFKKDVLTELPEKTRAMVPVLLDNEAEYRQVERDLKAWLKSQGREAALQNATTGIAKIEYCKQVALKGKLAAACDWIADMVESTEKIVVFVTHRVGIEALKKYFGDTAVYIDGSRSIAQRDEAMQAFQTDPNVKVFIGQLVAAGTGLDGLQKVCSNVVFLELGWTPGEHDQAEDRCHRSGQDLPVNAWYLIAPETVDESIARLIDAKRAMITKLIDEPGKTVNTNIYNELVAGLFDEA